MPSSPLTWARAAVAVLLVVLGCVVGYVLGISRAHPPRPSPPQVSSPAQPLVTAVATLGPRPSPASASAPPVARSVSSVHGPRSPEGWRTYRNETYGFALRYPDSWAFHEAHMVPDHDRGTTRLLVLTMGPVGDHRFGEDVWVTVEPSANYRTNEDYFAGYYRHVHEVKRVGPVRLNGVEGEKWSYNPVSRDETNQHRDNYAIFFVRDGKRYVVRKESFRGLDEANRQVEQVIASFAFDDDR